jgi:hypothetical protein
MLRQGPEENFTVWSVHGWTAEKLEEHTEVYPNSAVYRGVKADLRGDYPKGRKFTWHGFIFHDKDHRSA